MNRKIQPFARLLIAQAFTTSALLGAAHAQCTVTGQKPIADGQLDQTAYVFFDGDVDATTIFEPYGSAILVRRAGTSKPYFSGTVDASGSMMTFDIDPGQLEPGTHYETVVLARGLQCGGQDLDEDVILGWRTVEAPVLVPGSMSPAPWIDACGGVDIRLSFEASIDLEHAVTTLTRDPGGADEVIPGRLGLEGNRNTLVFTPGGLLDDGIYLVEVTGVTANGGTAFMAEDPPPWNFTVDSGSPVLGANACGGCTELADTPGDSCDLTGTWTCETTDSMVCLGGVPPASPNINRDILSMDLDVDLSTDTAVATLTLAPSQSTGATFEAQGLTVTSVTKLDGSPLDFQQWGGGLHVGVPTEEPTLVVAYEIARTTGFDGLHDDGFTYIWPNYCGNLFPCHSSPADGLTYTLSVNGAPDGQIVQHASGSEMDVPSYAIGWNTRSESRTALVLSIYRPDEGSLDSNTEYGTRITAYSLSPNYNFTQMVAGTRGLMSSFEWLESQLGPSPQGPDLQVHEVDYPSSERPGIETAPYWHLDSSVTSSRQTHVHESIHGWFGNGVRMRCWEDFVMSEGATTYLAALAFGHVDGEAATLDEFVAYRNELNSWMTAPDIPKVAWPGGCNDIDIIEDGMYTGIPYFKGALFLKAVEDEVGREPVVAALATFVNAHLGEAAGMQDLIDVLEAETDIDPAVLDGLVWGWLKSEPLP